jgi:hypothetical protein
MPFFLQNLMALAMGVAIAIALFLANVQLCTHTCQGLAKIPLAI